MTYEDISFRLGKIAGVALSGHRHNCGKGPAPNDCSRLDYIELMLRNLCEELQDLPSKESPV